MNKDTYNYTITWTQPYNYQVTWNCPQEIDNEEMDLTEANELIARIKNDIRD